MLNPKDFYDNPAPRTLLQLLSYMIYCQQVRRFHTEPMLQPPCIGQHSGGVARMCLLLTHGRASAALLANALHHDDGEQINGDMPAPAKRALSTAAHASFTAIEMAIIVANVPYFCSIEKLSLEEERILHLADRMQGMLECVLERNLGNKLVLRPFQRLLDYAMGEVSEGTNRLHELSVLDTITTLWEEANR